MGGFKAHTAVDISFLLGAKRTSRPVARSPALGLVCFYDIFSSGERLTKDIN